MEFNRNNQNYHYRRDYQRTPYDREFSRERRENFRSQEGSFQSRTQNFRSRGNQNWRSRDSHPRQNHNNFNQSNVGTWPNSGRTFDQTGREIGGYEGFNHRRNHQDNNYLDTQKQQQEGVVHPMLSPLEEKARDFLNSVLGQPGIRSKLIFLETVENALQTLQGTVDYCQLQMTVEQNATGEFVMRIDREQVASGNFPNKQAAKTALAEKAMEVLRRDCFYIIKKKVYEEVTTKKNEPKVEAKPQTDFGGSKAHQMMLKMGWGGKGLGVNEQGAEKTVAETLDQNVSRQGLGTDDVFKKIHKLLEDYSKSDKISLFRFDPDFTSEERAHIHKIAAKFGLKSKSEGKGELRRITITKKLHRGDLVYNLLTSDLENTLYKLIIPSKFEHLWNDDEEDDEDKCE